jgi:hypothetical protein
MQQAEYNDMAQIKGNVFSRDVGFIQRDMCLHEAVSLDEPALSPFLDMTSEDVEETSDRKARFQPLGPYATLVKECRSSIESLGSAYKNYTQKNRDTSPGTGKAKQLMCQVLGRIKTRWRRLQQLNPAMRRPSGK